MRSIHPLRGLAGFVMVTVALAACGARPASPSVPPLAVATISVKPTPALTPIWTLITDGDLPSSVITQMARDTLVAEAHGGGNAHALPAQILIDYRVRGVCEFTIAIYSQAPGTTGPSARLSVRANSETMSRTWAVELSPGLYEISPNATDGCTFLITVRSA